jgi:hypothetical protein
VENRSRTEGDVGVLPRAGTVGHRVRFLLSPASLCDVEEAGRVVGIFGRRWKRAPSPGAQILFLVDTQISNAAASDLLENPAADRQGPRNPAFAAT